MLIYNIIFSINFLLAIINIKNTKQAKKLLFISFSVLSTFLCLNYTNGIDWTSYQTSFIEILSLDKMIETKNYYASIPERNYDEKFFYYLMSLFKMFGFNYEMFQYIVLNLVMFTMYKLIGIYTDYSLVCILVYYSYFMIGNFFEPAFRQFIAISFFYISIKDIVNKNFIKYLIKILLGYLFHTSILFFLLIYFIPKKKIKTSFLLFVFLVVFIIAKFLNNILEVINIVIPILEKYLIYFENEKYGFKDSINLVFYIKIITAILIGIYIDKNKKYLKIKDSQKFYLILNFYWINQIFFILKRQIVIFYRMQYYFEIFHVIGIAFLVEILIKKYGKKIGFYFLVILSIISYRAMYKGMISWKGQDSMKFFPYTNYITEIIFNKKIRKGYEKIEYRLLMRKEESSGGN